MCSQVWKGMALLISGELPRVFCEAPGADSSDWDESLREAGDFVLPCSLQNLTLSYFHSSFAMSATPLVK